MLASASRRVCRSISARIRRGQPAAVGAERDAREHPQSAPAPRRSQYRSEVSCAEVLLLSKLLSGSRRSSGRDHRTRPISAICLSLAVSCSRTKYMLPDSRVCAYRTAPAAVGAEVVAPRPTAPARVSCAGGPAPRHSASRPLAKARRCCPSSSCHTKLTSATSTPIA